MKKYNLVLKIPISFTFDDEDITEEEFIKSLLKIYKEEPEELIHHLSYDIIHKKKKYEVEIKKH